VLYLEPAMSDDPRPGARPESEVADYPAQRSYMLAHNIRFEEDLIDDLVNSSEKRLAPTLLLLARYGEAEQPLNLLPRVSQETLASMVGTTRSRVNSS
jgi:CRP-like cAMP-binding protein